MMKTVDEQEFSKENVFGLGEFNQGFAEYFSGKSYLNPLTNSKKTIFLTNVTFEPA